jgi:hypothetical protein
MGIYDPNNLDGDDSDEDDEESMSVYEEEDLMDEEEEEMMIGIDPTMSFDEDLEELHSYRNN